MQDFYIECSIGGRTVVKVTAESLDKALELSALMTIDDFENAGSLKISDVYQAVVNGDIQPPSFDSAIKQVVGADYEYAADDPIGRGPE